MGIFDRLSAEEINSFNIRRLEANHEDILGVKNSLSEGFDTEYPYKTTKKSFDTYEYYGIIDNGLYSVIGVAFADKNTKPDYIKKAIKSKRYIVIANLVSRKKGRGKLLVEYVLNKYSSFPCYLTSRTKSLIPYYEQFGFKLIETDKENHYPMVRQ
jgi:hypothetical protein